MDSFYELKAEWIWLLQEKRTVNQYVDFRHEFYLDDVNGLADNEGFLYISADSEYAVWINGCFADCNQYDDYPLNKAYDMLNIRKHLRNGKNVLCILGYYQGEDSFQYIKGRPGLIYALKAGKHEVVSGSNTYCRQSVTYKSGYIEKITTQLAFTFDYNGINYDDWLLNQYEMDISQWAAAAVVEGMAAEVELYKRPVRKLITDETAKGKIIAQGYFVRDAVNAGYGSDKNMRTTAELMQKDYLSSRLPVDVFGRESGYDSPLPSEGLHISDIPEGNDGVYVIIDLQREETGYFEFEADGEEGAVIEAGYGQHLEDMRVRAFVGGRNFAFRYTCSNGYQKFTHYMKRLSGRYIQLHISGIKKGITIYYAGIRPARYPLELKGSFICNDRLLNKIYDVSVRTLELCTHEHYEDTPWREQGMYSMDSRNQALCGYYCFGEYDFPDSSFSLFMENLGDDGHFEICTPAKFRKTIPSFTMGWILAVSDLILYSGRMDTAKKLFPVVKKILDISISNMENGLLKTPAGERYWNFYEWADGLDGSSKINEASEDGVSVRYDAPLNLFFCMALKTGAEIAKWIGDTESESVYGKCFDKLRNSIHKTFWDDSAGAYRTYIGSCCNNHYAELTQSLALCSGTVPENIATDLRSRLSQRNNSLIRTTLSYALYKYEALMQEADRYGSLVFDDIAGDWGYMLYNKATSFWETIKGADDFEKAGSLCHGWSAIPVYFFHAYILGIKPLEPGFRKFSAAPVINGANSFSGRVPTPYGDILVERELDGDNLKYTVNFPEKIARV